MTLVHSGWKMATNAAQATAPAAVSTGSDAPPQDGSMPSTLGDHGKPSGSQPMTKKARKTSEAAVLRRKANQSCQAKDLHAALAAVEEMRSKGYKVLLDVYNFILHTASNEGNAAAVDRVVAWMAEDGVASEPTCSVLVKEYARRGNLSAALEQLEATKALPARPRLRTYGPIFALLSRIARNKALEGPADDTTNADADADTTAVAASGSTASDASAGAGAGAGSGAGVSDAGGDDDASGAGSSVSGGSTVSQPPPAAPKPVVRPVEMPDPSEPEVSTPKDRAAAGELALKLYREVQAAGLDPTEPEYCSLIETFAATGRHELVLQELLPAMMELVYRVSEQGIVALTAVFSFGFCKATGGTLRSLLLQPEELERLKHQTEALATADKRAIPAWNEFKAWLHHNGPFDVIIDGANVGYHAQNHSAGEFSYQQIDDVMRHFQTEGKRVLLVLHDRWFNPRVDRGVVKRKRGVVVKRQSYGRPPPPPRAPAPGVTGPPPPSMMSAGIPGVPMFYPRDVVPPRPVPGFVPPHPRPGGMPPVRPAAAAYDDSPDMAIVRRWRASNQAYAVKPGRNDDLLWLYAAVYSGRNVSVVTNDLMRDHHFNMLAPRDFLKWRERHRVQFKITTSRSTGVRHLTFKHPSKFSHRTQPSEAGDAWYFPAGDTDREWLACWKPASTDTK